MTSGATGADHLAPGPFKDLSDTLLGWGSRTELELASALEAHPYFPDTGLRADELERIEKLFGILLSRQLKAGATLSELLEVTPALSAATLISRSMQVRDAESFAEEYLVGVGLEPTSENISTIDDMAAGLLASSGLAPLDGDVRSDLAVQAGLVTAEVPALLEYLDAVDPLEQPDAVDDCTSTERASRVHVEEALEALINGSFTEVLDEREEEQGEELSLELTALSARKAPEIFRRILSGLRELRSYSLQHPSSWLDRDRSHFDVQLPPVIEESVIAELKERPVGTSNRSYAVGVAIREMRPRLLLDTVRRRVCLRLPQQRVATALGGEEDNAQVAWRVNQGGSTRLFRTWRPDPESVYSETLDIAVEHQVSELTVADTTNGITWVIPVVDADDPVLIFSEQGQDLTGKASLHHERLYVLAPKDARLIDVVADSAIEPVDSFEIQGWRSWQAHLIDTTGVFSLQVLREGQTSSAMYQLRSIDTRRRVRFVHPASPYLHLRTHGGLRVHSESLIAEFPATQSGRDEVWHLSIAASGRVGESAEEIAAPEPLEVPAEGGAFPIFDPEAYDSPWVGEYLIRLRGPRNESFRHRYAIVEGISTELSIKGGSGGVRIPAGDGLSPARMSIRCGEKPFAVSPKEVEVEGNQARSELTISTADGDVLPLLFTPPTLRFDIPVLSYPPMWRTSRLFLHSRNIDPTGRIRVRSTAELRDVRITVSNQHGSPVKTSAMQPEDPVTYGVPAEEIAGAITSVTAGRLELQWTDNVHRERISVIIAETGSRAHATAVSISEGALHFEELVSDRRMGAWIWPATAPWAQVRVIDTVDEVTALPEELIDAGDLIVQLHTADPITQLRTPLHPGNMAMLAQQPGYFRDQPEELQELSGFLAGEAEELPRAEAVLPVIWEHFGDTARERDVAGAVFHAAPAAALRGLASSLVPAHLQPGRMILTGLVNHAFPGEDIEDSGEKHRSAWITTMLLLGALPAALDKVGDSTQAQRILDRIHDVAGKPVVDTLLTGRDLSLDNAVIDASTVRIASMDPAQQQQLIDMLFASGDIVPGPIMSEGSRFMAVFESFRRREELREVVASEQLIKPAVSLLRALRKSHRVLYTSARIRLDKLDGVNTDEHDNAWALGPVVSLVFAIAARLHAHGLMGKSTVLEQAAVGWSQLADIVPDLVTGDLISAEAMVIASAKRH